MLDVVVLLATVVTITFNGLVLWKSKSKSEVDEREEVLRPQKGEDADKDSPIAIQEQSREGTVH